MSEVYPTKENYEELNDEIQALCNLYFWLKHVEDNKYGQIDIKNKSITISFRSVLFNNPFKQRSTGFCVGCI